MGLILRFGVQGSSRLRLGFDFVMRAGGVAAMWERRTLVEVVVGGGVAVFACAVAAKVRPGRQKRAVAFVRDMMYRESGAELVT